MLNTTLLALDLGIKKNILNSLTRRGVNVTVFPARTPYETLAKGGYSGYFISNGPGDPAATDYAIKTAAQMVDSAKPVFGICMGHQLLAQVFGISTYKMHNGHRGLNHPVLNKLTNKAEITSQNHGFGVNPDALRGHQEIEVTHINLNDNTVEGMRHKELPVLSVQYHPEAAPGPNDAGYLFDEFIRLIDQN